MPCVSVVESPCAVSESSVTKSNTVASTPSADVNCVLLNSFRTALRNTYPSVCALPDTLDTDTCATAAGDPATNITAHAASDVPVQACLVIACPL